MSRWRTNDPTGSLQALVEVGSEDVIYSCSCARKHMWRCAPSLARTCAQRKRTLVYLSIEGKGFQRRQGPRFRWPVRAHQDEAWVFDRVFFLSTSGDVGAMHKCTQVHRATLQVAMASFLIRLFETQKFTHPHAFNSRAFSDSFMHCTLEQPPVLLCTPR